MCGSDGAAGGGAPPAHPHGRATLTIDLGAIAANFRLVCSKLAGARCGAVVKADAYSLGMGRVAPALAAAGCREFFVADLDEGLALRRLLPTAKIYVLNGPPTDGVADLIHHRLVPVLNDLDQIALWRAEAGGDGAAMLHIDTGMSRLGLGPEELDVLARDPRLLEGFALDCVLSHMACADDPDHPFNRHQLAAFAAARACLPAAPASLANSAAVLLGPQYHFDLVRPGGALYGLAPFVARPNPMAPVVRLEAPILQVRDVDSPMTVGYGATYKIPRRGRIATIPVGYADGYLRSLGNRGNAFVGDVCIPVIGRVSMDLVTLDVSGIAPAAARPGATVEILGEHQGVDDLAAAAGTIGHEILTSLGHRYRRRYVEAGAAADRG